MMEILQRQNFIAYIMSLVLLEIEGPSKFDMQSTLPRP